MIKINLLPPAFRVAKKKKKAKPAPDASKPRTGKEIPWKIIGIAGGSLFLLLTLVFDFQYIGVNKKMKTVSRELAAVQPQMQSLKALETEVTTVLVPEKDFLTTHVLSKAPITVVLQKMSEALPDGVWLQDFVIHNSGKARSFQVKGLAINIENKTNIEQIEEFLQKLKTAIPSAQFTYSTSKQVVDKTQVTAFSAEYKWQAD